MKYSIFHVQGGIGKHVAATAVAQAIQRNYPDRKLVVACAYPDIFINLDFVYRVYQLGSSSYFYQTYIAGQDSLIFHHEPYFTTDHIYKRLPLAENWCKMYGIAYKGERPVVHYNRLQKSVAKKHWTTGKPTMVLHTNGGVMTTDAKPYSWTRDMPLSVAQAVVEHFHPKYQIYQITKINSPKLDHCTHIYATPQQSLSTMELFSVLLHSSKRLLIDSCMQHAAAALEKPSTVLWVGTSPAVFGYSMHNNITTQIPLDFKLPNSYLFDFDFNGNELEYPFTQDQQLFNVNEVIASLERQ